MSRWMNEVKSLAQLRDELRLKAHLLEADARERFEGLERDFEKLEQEVASVKGAAGEAGGDVSAAAKLLLESVRSGFERIRKAL